MILDSGMILGILAIAGIVLFLVLVGWLRGPAYGPGRHGRLPQRFIHAGSPTNLRFTDDGKIIDKNGIEVKTISFEEWSKGIKK